MQLSNEEIQEKLKLYEWYHIIQVAPNIFTPGEKGYLSIQKNPLEMLNMLDLNDKKVLDIGCRDGLFSLEAERLGAKEIIGIDNDLSKGAVEFLIPYFNSQVKMYELNLLDLKPETFGSFDLVIFCGVLYHLRYPFWGIKLIRDILKPGAQLLIETGVMLNSNQIPLLFCPIGEQSPYEPTSCTFFNLKGLEDTLYSLGLEIEFLELMYDYSPEQWKEKFNTDVSVIAGNLAIDRATVLCTYNPDIIDNSVTKYWDNIHKEHTKNHK